MKAETAETETIALQKTQEPEEIQSQPSCPHCGSKNVYGISRVVGYFSKIDNWNASKKAEFAARRKGNYKI